MKAMAMRRVWMACLVAAVVWVSSGALMTARAEQAAPPPAAAQTEHAGGEANLVLPDLSTQSFLNGIDGHTLLLGGMVICVLGLVFGLVIMTQLKNLPVHPSMREISELIYETCKT